MCTSGLFSSLISGSVFYLNSIMVVESLDIVVTLLQLHSGNNCEGQKKINKDTYTITVACNSINLVGNMHIYDLDKG